MSLTRYSKIKENVSHLGLKESIKQPIIIELINE